MFEQNNVKMVSQFLNSYRAFRIRRKYEILLVSFLILIFGSVFFHSDFDSMPILIFQNVIASIIIFYGKKKWRLLLFALFVVLMVLELVNLFTGFSSSRILFSIAYVIYFIFLSVEVYRQVLTARDVDFGMVSAVLTGFIILGLIGGTLFSIIEFYRPNSFNNISEGAGAISDLIYFSLITIISIGYGDITPATEIARKAAMFFGLMGYFYGVVVIGIIMGKYLAKRT